VPNVSRLSTWEKAKADWHGVHGKRELVVAGVGAVISACVLLVAGFPHDAVVLGVSILGSAIALAVIVPAAELYWSWLQAPMRLLTDEVVAIREWLEQLELGATSATRAELGLRHALMDHKRVGDELVAEAANYGLRPSDGDAQVWTNSVIAFLGAHLAAGLDEFMTAGKGSSRDRISGRLDVLGRMVEHLEVEAGLDGAKGPPALGLTDEATTAPLSTQLQDLLRRGQDCRSRARISIDGSSAPIEMWEEDVVRVLKDNGRDDLALRFERRWPAPGFRSTTSERVVDVVAGR
jgi:hypothetical protein